MEFKKLELEPESGWIKRNLGSQQFKKSLLYIAIGALVSFLLFYFSEGQAMEVISAGDVIKSLAIGGFFGFFITNSPCARGRC